MAGRLLSIKILKWLKLILAIGVFSAVATLYFPNYAKLKQLRNENQKLIFENQRLEKEVDSYTKKLEELGEDSYLYEKIARDDLGIAKEGEIVIDIEE